jgi:ATP-dependent DNA helicase RecG
MVNFNSPVGSISPIAKKINSKLKRLGIISVSDLVYYYPFRYDDFTNVKKINDLVPGEVVTIEGRVDLIKNRRSSVKRRNITEAVISDETGSMKVVWFNQSFLIKNIRPGNNIYLSGKIDTDFNSMQMVSPEYEKVRKDASNTGRLVPVYPLTQGTTNKQIRFFIRLALPLIRKVEDWMPVEIKDKLNLIDLNEALKQIHFPDNAELIKKARIRLKFDELFLVQLQKQSIKNKNKKNVAEKIEFKEKEIKKFVDSLPFTLTDDQRKSSWSILNDLQRGYPMNRLLDGDVGSGKTVVSAIAMLNVVLNGRQSAYMAPTEILAKQQYESLKKDYKDFNINLALLTRSEQKICSSDEKIKKADFFKKISNGEIDIIIGTHALIQNKVEFKNLALVVVDEQHRFGVEQRGKLIQKSGNKKTSPHFLSMTATPIPRTLHLAIYGDLDLSIIREMPKDRKKITTKIIEPSGRSDSYKFIRNQVEEGRQIFVICPLIDESDKLGVKSVAEEYERLNEKVFPDIKIGKLHGKLKSAEKEEIMKDFLDNKIKILVSTSVVEVGVDIPNATVMLIEGAERFGLAQLHQFRGRVGRSKYQSYCLLFSDSMSESTLDRLEALKECSDGFELAKRDLEFRGYGDIYGKMQSGMSEFKIASLSDFSIIQKANDEATRIMDEDPEFNKYPALKEKIKQFEESVHLE